MTKKYKTLLLSSVGLLSILKVSLTLADGVFMSSEQYHLYSPEQKAIIAWDGKIEQMVLASKVQTDQISNMVWVIPVQSWIKPEVQKSDFSIFKGLIAYFAEKERGSQTSGRDGTLGKNEMEGVEIIETKKVDIYDVTILKATSTDDLFQWLNTNGYQVTEDIKPTIEKYIQRPSMYFVANKIDLRNKFLADTQQAQDFYEGVKRRLEEKQRANTQASSQLRDDQVASCSSWQSTGDGREREKEFSACAIEAVKTHFAQMGKNVQTITPDPHFLNTAIFSIDGHWTVTFADFEKFDNSYFSIQHDRRMVLTDFFPRAQGRDMTGSLYLSSAISQEAQQYADMIRMVLTRELAFKKELDQKIHEVNTEAKDIAAVLSAVSHWGQDKLFCGAMRFLENFTDGARHKIMIDTVSGILPDPSTGKTDYCQTLASLQSGAATPLKISFEPDTPYYPLEISSLGEGSTMIDVYVIADGAAGDRNKVFEDVRPLVLNGILKEKVAEEFHVGHWTHVTRFTWRGRLKDLKKDAVFALPTERF